MSENLLAKEKSPYLRLHKDNPVQWRPWGPEALAEAKEQNKPILLSIGYTACHWCHVMNHESFADAETAQTMNKLFINVKVDREERPDIDQLYQAASIQMGHGGGWPLNIFLTPEGKPFMVGGYLPANDTGQSQGFKSTLAEIERIYREEPQRVTQANDAVSASLDQLWGRDLRTQVLPASALEFLWVRVGQRFDVFFGGILGATKFPSTKLVEFLFRGYLRSGASVLQQLARATLDSMCLGGMYDHVGGGFHRYVTDERWMIPHFEKMLYDNALLVELQTFVWKNNRHPLYATRVAETIDWLLRDMRVGDAFASALDADSEGEEGRYYIWTEAEIDAAIAGTFSQRFKQIYNISRAGNFQGRNVLNRIGTAAYPMAEADEALFRKQLQMLLAARSKRVAPLRDDKILTDCNAMLVTALARAGTAFRRPDWVKQAITTFDFIADKLGDGDRLCHSMSDGHCQHTGFADDYAHMARAAHTLYETTGEKRYLELAKKWTAVLDVHFWDAQKGGYCYSADYDEPLIARVRTPVDQATPNANGVMIEVLSSLYATTGDKAYRGRANGVVQAFSRDLSERHISYGAYLDGLDTLMGGMQVVIVGRRDNAKTQELIGAVNGRSLPGVALTVVDPDETFPETHPAFGKTMQGGVPTAYICQHENCSQPVTSPVTLSQMLQMPAQRVAGNA